MSLHSEKNQQKFIIQGGKPLKGTVTISGSKNAALPILCAALLTSKKTTIHNIPDIADIHTLLEIFTALNVKSTFVNHTVTLDASSIQNNAIPEKLISRMRASILLLGPLLSRFNHVKLPFPGGCVLGKRSVNSHTSALVHLGAEVVYDKNYLELKREEKRSDPFITMSEMSVTATENALMLAALTPGQTRLNLAAAEPHVQDLCHFLNSMGAKISGIGTHFLQIEGVENLHETEYTVTGDYLEAGTFAIAALVTGGEIVMKNIQTHQLESFWQKLHEMQGGVEYDMDENSIRISSKKSPYLATDIRTAVYPSFPTDLQAPFSVLLTQAEGESKIFETLFEGRLNYLYELEKMGANIRVLNPHEAIIQGPTKLKGIPIASIDIRAGAAMVLAALCAEGETEISNINYIDRGYEKIDEKLRSLGAKITRQ